MVSYDVQLGFLIILIAWQSIYFEGLEGMVQCIEAISADPETQVERVLNRLHYDYDSTTTAGYRDVALNLRLQMPDTVHLGLNGHICEVQLVLISFAKIKASFIKIH